MLLEVRDLEIDVARAQGRRGVVLGLDLQVDAGQALALVGESGAGKSLTALAIMGLLPDAVTARGQVLLEGQELLGLAPAVRRRLCGRRLAMVFQDAAAALNPLMAVGAQVAESARLHLGLDGAGARRRAIELLAEVGVDDPERRAAQLPHELSGGLCQRALLAVALAGEPAVLLADEPTSALDAIVQAQVLTVLKAACLSRGMALVLIAHDLSAVAGHCSEVAVMYAGRVVERGPTELVLRRPAHPYTRGLVRAVPGLSTRGQRLAAPPPRPDGAGDWPSGCAFRDRCARASARCAEQRPELASSGPGGSAACHHPEEGS